MNWRVGRAGGISGSYSEYAAFKKNNCSASFILANGLHVK